MTAPNEREALPPRLIAGAGLYAAAELTLGLASGFFAWGRAEALLFLAFRPWLLLIAAILVARRRWPQRIAFYGFALLLAGTSEALLLARLGASDPGPETLRGIAAGTLLVLVLDLLIRLGIRLHRRFGRPLAAAGILLAFLFAGALAPYERLAIGAEAAPRAAERPRLLVMTGLPVVWGEMGPFDPASRPAAFYRMLEDEFDVVLADHLDEGTLEQADLMLLAQPRALVPAELAALEGWVRTGGRVLILTDPQLGWPSRLPLGDMRRPPPVSYLTPLLRHWGLRLEQSGARGLELLRLESGGKERRLLLAESGRFDVSGEQCRTTLGGRAASCRIGSGRALLLADADLVRDELWTLRGTPAGARRLRTADNPLVLLDWLDRLAGIERERRAGAVAWIDPEAPRGRAAALAALPSAAALLAALLLWRRRARCH